MPAVTWLAHVPSGPSKALAGLNRPAVRLPAITSAKGANTPPQVDAEPRQKCRRPEVACEPTEQPKAQAASETVWGALLLGDVSRAETLARVRDNRGRRLNVTYNHRCEVIDGLVQEAVAYLRRLDRRALGQAAVRIAKGHFSSAMGTVASGSRAAMEQDSGE